MVNLFKNQSGSVFPDDDAQHLLPFRRLVVSYDDLGSGGSDTIAFPTFQPRTIPFFALAEITAAWTAEGGDTTGVTAQIGDAGDPDEMRGAGQLVGASVGLVPGSLMGAGTRHFNPAMEITAYAPIITFTATGGSTELDHIDAGALAARIYYFAFPENL